jgi:hypothetical protein
MGKDRIVEQYFAAKRQMKTNSPMSGQFKSHRPSNSNAMLPFVADSARGAEN